MIKEMKIRAGTAGARDETWLAELSDKPGYVSLESP